MGIELRPLGVACNIGCVYCYQDPMRSAGNFRQPYDLAKMKEALLRANEPFTVFGGEPLLVPIADLEELFALGLEKFGHNAIQTNGTLVTDAHLQLFRTYKVSVGISIDGPDELNDLRWHKNLEQTRKSTARIEALIAQLCAAGTPPGLIVTLHRGNATRAHLPKMHDWMRRLDALGVRSVRLHLLEVENETVRTQHALSLRENVEALLSFQQLQPELRLIAFDLFTEMETLLLGQEQKASCVWRNCDPYRTNAVVGIEGNGQSSNCGRTNKDGVDYTKADDFGYERYIALWQTPQAEGGCQGCRFFLMCRGQCPGTAIDGDWRNRSELCEVWKALFSRIERKLILDGRSPLSLSPLRRTLEANLVESWKRGRNSSLSGLPQVMPAAATRPPSDGRSAPAPARRKFLRLAWVTDQARQRWEPRLLRVQEALLRVAVAWVADGRAPCAVRRVPAALKPELLRRASAAGLVAHELDPVAPTTAASPGRVLLGSDESVRAYLALASNDADGDRRRAELLGYPACCIAAHDAASAAQTEPLWIHPATAAPVDDAGIGAPQLPTAHAAVLWSEEPLTHVFFRRLGLSFIPHLPCARDCSASREVGIAIHALGQALGLGEEMAQLNEMLRWPVHISLHHGIAEIRTPVFKLACDAETTPRKIELRYGGSVVPEFAVRGRGFPFLQRPQPSPPWSPTSLTRAPSTGRA